VKNGIVAHGDQHNVPTRTDAPETTWKHVGGDVTVAMQLTHNENGDFTMTDITAILAKPEEFGFTFLTETVKRDRVSSGPVPLIKVIDLLKFEKNFPGVLLETEDGQSIRVNGQRVVRDAWFSGDHDQKSLKTRLVRWLLKIEQPSAKFGPGPDGQFYATSEELTAAWMAVVDAVQTKVKAGK
jgi:hypothetical protein